MSERPLSIQTKAAPVTAPSIYPINVLSLLNFCKGLAIAWIFLVHLKGGWWGWQGVHLFIVLSGFGLTYACLQGERPTVWRQWYLRRAERILPTYWLVALVGCLLLIGVRILMHNFAGWDTLRFAAIRLVLDLSLARDLYYKTVASSPNASLWFVPFIVSFYLIFPWLHTQLVKPKRLVPVLLGAVAIEFAYRAIALYNLDGFPLGYPDVLKAYPALHLPLNQLPDTPWLPFQRHAPFGLFPSRLAEFVLGMVGALILVRNRAQFNRLLSPGVGIAGVGVWLSGNALLYVGLWGWVVADFVIALGLGLWTLNLAWVCQQRFAAGFSRLSQLGVWSYSIFLTHYLFRWLFEETLGKPFHDSQSWAAKTLMLSFMVLGTLSTSWLVRQFDKSRWPQWLVHQILARLLGF